MQRRSFLQAALAAPALGLALPVRAQAPERRPFSPAPGRWREYEIVTQVDILEAAGTTRVWIPLPSQNFEFQQNRGNTWTGNATRTELFTDSKYGARGLVAEFAAGERQPTLQVVTRFAAQDRALDWSERASVALDPAEVKAWTAPTALMPTDGIVGRTARQIVRGRSTDVERTRTVYDWVIANTYREPKVRGCGTGDIAAMLETGNMGGKCGDINGLFVGLMRAAGVPARDVYGIRTGASAFGYRSLGANTPDITRAQHCRAEVFLRGYGWVGMDPADVGKVAREETAEWLKDPAHPIVASVRPRLFGGWEGNWLGYNVAHDLALPGAKGPRVGFFMYPVAEVNGVRRDSLDPDTFRYRITARTLTAA